MSSLSWLCATRPGSGLSVWGEGPRTPSSGRPGPWEFAEGCSRFSALKKDLLLTPFTRRLRIASVPSQGTLATDPVRATARNPMDVL